MVSKVGIATYIMSKVQDHRYVRVETVLNDTGFFDYVATLDMKKTGFFRCHRSGTNTEKQTYLFT